MDLGFLGEYCIPIVMGICLCVGYIVKKWINDVGYKYIPSIVAMLGSSNCSPYLKLKGV